MTEKFIKMFGPLAVIAKNITLIKHHENQN
jgi:hypothetical protein